MEVGSVVRAVFEFLPSVSEELPLFTGDVIEVLSIVDEFWLLGNKDGVTGQFPSTFVEEVTIPSSRPGDRLHVCINDFSSSETGRLPLRRGNLPVMQEVYSDPLSFGFQSVLALFQWQTQWGAEPQQVWNVASMTLDCRADIPLILQEQRIYSRYGSRWNTGDVVVVEVGGSKDLGETWQRGCNALGARGLFPTSCVKELNLSGRSRQLSERSAQAQALDIPPYALGQARALMSLHAQLNEELDFREGDLIIITGLPESGWFQGELEGRRGIFPEGFVELLGPLRSPQEPADCQYLSHGSEQFSYEDSFDGGEGTEEEGAGDGDVFVREEEEQKVAEEQEPEEEEGGVFAVALYDFRAMEAGELDFDTGDRIRVLSTLADGWLEGALRGRYGIFPHRFVKIQDDQQKPVDAVELENGQENISGPPSPNGTEIDPEWRTYEDHTVWDLDYFERTEEQTGKCESAGPKSGSRAQQRGEADPQPRRPAAPPQQRPERPRSTPPARPKLPSRLSLPSQRNDPSSDTHQSKNANGTSRSLQSRLSHTLPNTQSGWSRDSRYRQSPPDGASTNSKSLTLIQGLVSLAQSQKKMTRHASVNDADLMTGDPQARRSQKSFRGSSGLRTFATSASDLETKLSQQLFEFEKSLITSWSDTSVSSALPRGVTSVDDPSQLSQISRHFSILDYSDESDIIRGSHQSSSLERRLTLRPPPPRPSVLRRLATANYKPARPAPRRPPQRQNTAPPNSNSITNIFYSPDEVASSILDHGPGDGQEFGDLAAAQEQEIQRNLEAEKELEREMELEDERQREEEKRYQLLLRLQEVEQDMEAYAHTAEELRTMLDEEEDETARMQALENLEFCNYTLETLALEQQQLQGRSLVGARA